MNTLAGGPHTFLALLILRSIQRLMCHLYRLQTSAVRCEPNSRRYQQCTTTISPNQLCTATRKLKVRGSDSAITDHFHR